MLLPCRSYLFRVIGSSPSRSARWNRSHAHVCDGFRGHRRRSPGGQVLAWALPADVTLSLEDPATHATTQCTLAPLQYPRGLRAVGAQGTVVIELRLSARGKVIHTAVQESSGIEPLDMEAMRQVRAARCQGLTEPATGALLAGSVFPRLRFTLPSAAPVTQAGAPGSAESPPHYNAALSAFIRATPYYLLKLKELDKLEEALPDVIQSVPKPAVFACLRRKLTVDVVEEVVRPAYARTLPDDVALLQDLTELLNSGFGVKSMGQAEQGKDFDLDLFTPAEIQQAERLLSKPAVARFMASKMFERIKVEAHPFYLRLLADTRAACIRELAPANFDKSRLFKQS
ncbi:TonB family protein [Cupriavidus sp. CP313]